MCLMVCHDDDGEVELYVLRCQLTLYLGTNSDQCWSMVQCCFTSTETIRLFRTKRHLWLWNSTTTLHYSCFTSTVVFVALNSAHISCTLSPTAKNNSTLMQKPLRRQNGNRGRAAVVCFTALCMWGLVAVCFTVHVNVRSCCCVLHCACECEVLLLCASLCMWMWGPAAVLVLPGSPTTWGGSPLQPLWLIPGLPLRVSFLHHHLSAWRQLCIPWICIMYVWRIIL